MRILGIDPGLRVTGYGVIEVSNNGRLDRDMRLVEMGVIRTPTGSGIAARLDKLHRGLSEAAEELKPDVAVIEKLFAHYRHPATAILMAHARGIVCLVAAQYRMALHSVTTTHVKKSMTGRGHAGKHQVQRMVQHALGLKRAPEPADVTDALAVAIAYIHTMGRRGA